MFWSLIALVIGWIIASFVPVLFQRGVHVELLWSTRKTITKHCILGSPLALFISSVDVAIDVLILALPIYWVSLSGTSQTWIQRRVLIELRSESYTCRCFDDCQCVTYSLSVLCKLHSTNATKIKNEADWMSRALAASIERLVGYSLSHLYFQVRAADAVVQIFQKLGCQ